MSETIEPYSSTQEDDIFASPEEAQQLDIGRPIQEFIDKKWAKDKYNVIANVSPLGDGYYFVWLDFEEICAEDIKPKKDSAWLLYNSNGRFVIYVQVEGFRHLKSVEEREKIEEVIRKKTIGLYRIKEILLEIALEIKKKYHQDNIIEYACIDDVPLYPEIKIPPISFDNLPDYNLLKRVYADYISQATDAYPEYTWQNYISLTSAAVKRRIYYKMENANYYLNLWMLGLASSGETKTPPFNAVREIGRKAIGNFLLSKSGTIAGLLEEMATEITVMKSGGRSAKDKKTGAVVPVTIQTPQDTKNKSSQRALWIDEAGNFFATLNKPFSAGDKDTLNDLYSCIDIYTKRLANGKQIIIKDVYLPVNLYTLPAVLIEEIEQMGVLKGFFPRFNIMAPDYEKSRRPHKEESPDWEQIENNIVDMFKLIDNILPDNVAAPIRVTFGDYNDKDSIIRVWDDWCKERQEYFKREKDDTMGAYFVKAQMNVLKVAIHLELLNIPLNPQLLSKISATPEGISSKNNEKPALPEQNKEINIINTKLYRFEPPYTYKNNIDIHVNKLILSTYYNNIYRYYKLTELRLSLNTLKFAMYVFDSIYFPTFRNYFSYVYGGLNKNNFSKIIKIMKSKKKITRSELVMLSAVKENELDDIMLTLINNKHAGGCIVRTKSGSQHKYEIKEICYYFIPTNAKKLPFKPIAFDINNPAEHQGGFTLTPYTAAPCEVSCGSSGAIEEEIKRIVKDICGASCGNIKEAPDDGTKEQVELNTIKALKAKKIHFTGQEIASALVKVWGEFGWIAKPQEKEPSENASQFPTKDGSLEKRIFI